MSDWAAMINGMQPALAWLDMNMPGFIGYVRPNLPPCLPRSFSSLLPPVPFPSIHLPKINFPALHPWKELKEMIMTPKNVG
jgi:hypothetical protein